MVSQEKINELIMSGRINDFCKIYKDYNLKFEVSSLTGILPVSYKNNTVSLRMEYEDQLEHMIFFGIHELCHYIVSSPEQRELDNYGLEYMFPQEAFVEEKLTGNIRRSLTKKLPPEQDIVRSRTIIPANVVDGYDAVNKVIVNRAWPSSKKLTTEEKELINQKYLELQDKWYHEVGLKENNEFVYGKLNMTTQETKKELVSLVKSFIVS